MSRSHRKRHNKAPSLRWVDPLWAYLTHPALLGGLLMAAGLLVMSGPWLKLPARKVPGWWAMPVQATDVLQVAVLLGTAVFVIGVGLCVQAIRHTRDGARRRFMVSALLMNIGATGCVACWLSLQSDVPATQATFGIGQQVEYVVGRVRGEPVRVMLPRRVTVDKLVATSPASLTFTLSRPKQTDPASHTVAVGEAIEVDGTRFTFTGSGTDAQQLQGIVAGTSAQSIAAAARKGSTVRVTLDGPDYDVNEISLNYMGMGPAVQLESEDAGAFWVFSRQAESSARVFDHGLQLLRVESMPAAVMTVGPARAFEPLAVCAGLFILGLGGVLLWGGGPAGAPPVRREEEDTQSVSGEEE